ncbi:glycosyltransferase family 2 protein [Solibacillus sp. FSL K6-1523]|uniref:glycosyltransferase family 2 protein n=1 Tax=Solibacillus sp. FSL K6-1523 TaxID=2921471 RepID=UPI0030F7A455
MEPVIVLIPALNPLPTIIEFVEKLEKLAIEKIIIINDGSDEKYKKTFETLHNKGHVVLTHEQNFGKGRAIKTGLHYLLNSSFHSKGIVTVGAHGQHSVLDVEQIIMSTKIFSDGIILGVREFKNSDYSVLHQLQNRANSMLFELFFHKRLLDIQTGLRYIPRQHLAWLYQVKGETFNFDTNMLVEAIQRNAQLYEVPIGHAKLRKNSVIYYDEVIHPAKILQQLCASFRGNNARP